MCDHVCRRVSVVTVIRRRLWCPFGTKVLTQQQVMEFINLLFYKVYQTPGKATP